MRKIIIMSIIAYCFSSFHARAQNNGVSDQEVCQVLEFVLTHKANLNGFEICDLQETNIELILKNASLPADFEMQVCDKVFLWRIGDIDVNAKHEPETQNQIFVYEIKKEKKSITVRMMNVCTNHALTYLLKSIPIGRRKYKVKEIIQGDF